uniref:Mediator of RNA polymerase II transcription subunit 27 n=1 Tax=Oryza punctata TaxID=4537 RepID=A0A0E0JGQ5_ORYPU
MQQAQASAMVAAPAAAAAAGHQHEGARGDAPPKQVAQAMERLGRAGRLIADIRLGADRLLEALFVAGDAPPHSAPQHVEKTALAVAQEEAAMHRHFDDLRALGRQLEESGVLNGALKARGNSWGLHMPLVCPDGAVVAYAWKRQLAGQAGASAVDRTRLALKAFTDQKRRFFPHLDDEGFNHLHDGEPGLAKKPRLPATNGELEEKTLSEILKNLENEVPNMKIFTYRRLDWSKRAASLATLMNDDFVDPSKELNLQNMSKSGSGHDTTPINQVAIIELLAPSIFRAIVSLHPAGSTDPDAVAFFSPTEEHADKALQYFVSVEPTKSLSLLLRWIASYQTLFTKVCSKCGRLLLMDKSLALLLPPVQRPYHHQTSSVGSDPQDAYHIGCSSYDA